MPTTLHLAALDRQRLARLRDALLDWEVLVADRRAELRHVLDASRFDLETATAALHDAVAGRDLAAQRLHDFLTAAGTPIRGL